jgi:vacuolar-type H+-ATPase subunit E/Vma4
MAEPTPPPVDDAQVEGKMKKWFNDVLDERETKAAEAKAEADKEAEKEAAKRRTREPATILRNFLGY